MSRLDASLNDLNLGEKTPHKARSAMGIGIPTIVTIMVVLLLTTFAVLSLVSARSDLQLSQMSVDSAQNYYKADGQATEWYAKLCDELAARDFNARAGDFVKKKYSATDSKTGGLRVSEQFVIDQNRELAVTVKINAEGKPEIIQWQVTLVADDEE
jgi:hypothetical protein